MTLSLCRFTPQEEKFVRSSPIKKTHKPLSLRGVERRTKIGVSLNDRTKNDRTFTFSHPDYTVGFGITPNPALRLAGYEEFLQLPPIGNFTLPRR
jgi:hypothetical protein